MIENRFTRYFSDWKKYESRVRLREFPAKSILLREGEVSKNGFYIVSGCLRLWFNNDGKDVSFQFFFEGEGVSSVESFRTNRPSLFTIETIEPCTILSISKRDFYAMMEESEDFRKEVEEQSFQRLIYYQHLFLSRIKDSPQKRYEELIKNSPKILQRIPQHYIASYLGITPVSLSRIRNRR